MSRRFATSREKAVDRSGTNGHGTGRETHVVATTNVTLDGRPNDVVQVGALDTRLLVRSREVEKLADDPVHLVDVVDHAGTRRFVARLHFDAEPQPRERRAQVVRNAGEQDRTVVLELAQARHHAVHSAVELHDLGRSLLG